MDRQHVRDIVPGPRQILLFDRENELLDEQRRFTACLMDHFEAHGQLDLGPFIETAAGVLGWPEFDVLQHVFWLVYELKIHFRSNDQPIEPSAAKQLLIESPDVDVQLALNQPVEAAVFSRAKDLYAAVTDNSAGLEPVDQAGFARRLVKQIRVWKNMMENCMRFAQRPGFPGRREIEKATDTVGLVSDRLDPFSLINAFCDHAEKIRHLVATLQTLTDFYDRHAEQWQKLIEFARDSEKTLSDHATDPDIGPANERFGRIMSSDEPYDRLDDAIGLYKALEPYHLEVLSQQTQQRRMAALNQVEALIRKMKSHLRAHAASADMHNQSLYPLQKERRLIRTAATIAAIEHSVQTAKEAFEDSWEEVVDQARKKNR